MKKKFLWALMGLGFLGSLMKKSEKSLQELIQAFQNKSDDESFSALNDVAKACNKVKFDSADFKQCEDFFYTNFKKWVEKGVETPEEIIDTILKMYRFFTQRWQALLLQEYSQSKIHRKIDLILMIKHARNLGPLKADKWGKNFYEVFISFREFEPLRPLCASIVRFLSKNPSLITEETKNGWRVQLKWLRGNIRYIYSDKEKQQKVLKELYELSDKAKLDLPGRADFDQKDIQNRKLNEWHKKIKQDGNKKEGKDQFEFPDSDHEGGKPGE